MREVVVSPSDGPRGRTNTSGVWLERKRRYRHGVYSGVGSSSRALDTRATLLLLVVILVFFCVASLLFRRTPTRPVSVKPSRDSRPARPVAPRPKPAAASAHACSVQWLVDAAGSDSCGGSERAGERLSLDVLRGGNVIVDPSFEVPFSSDSAWAAVGNASVAKRTGRTFLFSRPRVDTSALRLFGPLSGTSQNLSLPRGVKGGCAFLSAWSADGDGGDAGSSTSLQVEVRKKETTRGPGMISLAMPVTRDWRVSYGVFPFDPSAVDTAISLEYSSLADPGASALVDDVKFAVITEANMCELGRLLALYERVKAQAEDVEADVEADDGACPGRPFFFAWSESSTAFDLVSLRAIESVLYHYPGACISVYSNTLPLLWFADAWSSGFSVNVVRYDLRSLAAKLPWKSGHLWLSELPRWAEEWRRHSHLSHEIDVLRWLVLATRGGIFASTSTVFLRPLPAEGEKPDTIATVLSPGAWWSFSAPDLAVSEIGNWSSLSLDSVAATGRRRIFRDMKPPEADARTHVSLAPGSVAIMARSNPFLECVLRLLDEHYDPSLPAGAGMVPASICFRSNQATVKRTLALEVPSHFCPVSPAHSPSLLRDPLTELWHRVSSHSTSIDLHHPSSLELHPGSLASLVLTHSAISDFPLFPNGKEP